MGMGYGANFAETITEKAVKTICPKEFELFEQAISEASVDDIEEFAQSIAYGDEAEDLETGQAYQALCEAFEKEIGLSVGLEYHDSDEQGDRYDDIDGYFWWVDGVYEQTKAAKKFEALGHKVCRMFYVTHG